jgi:hypothetical protein
MDIGSLMNLAKAPTVLLLAASFYETGPASPPP